MGERDTTEGPTRKPGYFGREPAPCPMPARRPGTRPSADGNAMMLARTHVIREMRIALRPQRSPRSCFTLGCFLPPNSGVRRSP